MSRKSKYSGEEFNRYKNVFDEKTRRRIFKLKTEGYFEALAEPIALGKEANVFTAEKEGGDLVVVKIYRIENSNFNKMSEYIWGDPRFDNIRHHRRKTVFNWVQREYRNLLLAREHLDVPTPYTFKANILVMELIGHTRPAPQLKDAHPRDVEDYMRRVKQSVLGLLDAGLVHGDLSQFNILNHQERPYFIDMGQASPLETWHSKDLLERDIDVISNFFKKITGEDVSEYFSEVFKKYEEKLGE